MQENFPEYSSIRAYKPLGEGPAPALGSMRVIAMLH
jgi:hypothetical protein